MYILITLSSLLPTTFLPFPSTSHSSQTTPFIQTLNSDTTTLIIIALHFLSCIFTHTIHIMVLNAGPLQASKTQTIPTLAQQLAKTLI